MIYFTYSLDFVKQHSYIRHMNAAQKTKLAGLKSLNELAEITGESRQTLNNWHRNKPIKFELILKGAVVKKLEGIK